MNKPQTGRCMCGEVVLEVSSDPISCGQCHCLQCQKNCGGSPSTFLMLPANAVKLTNGELRYFETVADSGNKIARGFCPTCGTPIMSKLERTNEIIIVKMGVMDDPYQYKPDTVYWTSMAHDWADIPENCAQFMHNPP